MIQVLLNAPDFEYDIHSLIKAFYPEEDVSVSAEWKEEKEPLLLQVVISYLHGETGCCGTAEKKVCRPDPGCIHITFLKPLNADWIREDNPGKTAQEKTEKAEDAAPLAFQMVLQGDTDVDFSDRLQTKNRLKQKLYRMLEEYSGKRLPWGTLTGIRPTKIPLKMLEEGKSSADIHTFMRQTYYASEDRITLAENVARRELNLLKGIDYKDGYSLYIGIPFCPTTCAYCSFPSFPLQKNDSLTENYLDALRKEIDFVSSHFGGRKLNSIYMGGGTPTTLQPEQMDRLLCKLEDSLDLSALSEFTVEAGRPDSITPEKLRVLRKHGINRISVNPQTMKQETLDLIGRRHTVTQTIEAFRLARKEGFSNINMDLIVGLPEETIEDVRHTMEAVAELSPDCITVHSLAIKRAARLRIQRENYRGLHMVNTWETIDLTRKYAEKMGLHPYYLYRQKNMAGNFENVGYARAGCEGLYNVLIMEEKQDIVAIGAGTVSKRVWAENGRIERCDNVKDVNLYIERIDEMIERKRKLWQQ